VILEFYPRLNRKPGEMSGIYLKIYFPLPWREVARRGNVW